MKVQHWMMLGLVAVSAVACSDSATAPLVAGEAAEARAAASQRPASVADDRGRGVGGERGEW
jgi:hypothetical protein